MRDRIDTLLSSLLEALARMDRQADDDDDEDHPHGSYEALHASAIASVVGSPDVNGGGRELPELGSPGASYEALHASAIASLVGSPVKAAEGMKGEGEMGVAMDMVMEAE